MLDLTRPAISVRQLQDALPEDLRGVQWLGAGLRGSHAHGTALPAEDPNATEDLDLFLVKVEKRETYLALNKRHRDQFDTAGQTLDILVYDARKFVRLLQDQNPNVHQWLHTRPIYETGFWQTLQKRAPSLISKQMFSRLIGYAQGQLDKMTKLAQEGLTGKGSTRFMGARRKELFGKYGYDVKNAAHALRLASVAKHLARDGQFVVELGEEGNERLRSVKKGLLTLSSVRVLFEHELTEFRKYEEHAPLPDRVPNEVFEEVWLEALDANCL